jgi:hypothetical protein
MLKQGAFLAVGTVTMLYIMVVAAYYAACDYAAITSLETDLGMAVIFAPTAFGQGLGLKVSISLSAVGNLVAVIYTSSKGTISTKHGFYILTYASQTSNSEAGHNPIFFILRDRYEGRSKCSTRWLDPSMDLLSSVHNLHSNKWRRVFLYHRVANV